MDKLKPVDIKEAEKLALNVSIFSEEDFPVGTHRVRLEHTAVAPDAQLIAISMSIYSREIDDQERDVLQYVSSFLIVRNLDNRPLSGFSVSADTLPACKSNFYCTAEPTAGRSFSYYGGAPRLCWAAPRTLVVVPAELPAPDVEAPAGWTIVFNKTLASPTVYALRMPAFPATWFSHETCVVPHLQSAWWTPPALRVSLKIVATARRQEQPVPPVAAHSDTRGSSVLAEVGGADLSGHPRGSEIVMNYTGASRLFLCGSSARFCLLPPSAAPPAACVLTADGVRGDCPLHTSLSQAILTAPPYRASLAATSAGRVVVAGAPLPAQQVSATHAPPEVIRQHAAAALAAAQRQAADVAAELQEERIRAHAEQIRAVELAAVAAAAAEAAAAQAAAGAAAAAATAPEPVSEPETANGKRKRSQRTAALNAMRDTSLSSKSLPETPAPAPAPALPRPPRAPALPPAPAPVTQAEVLARLPASTQALLAAAADAGVTAANDEWTHDRDLRDMFTEPPCWWSRADWATLAVVAGGDAEAPVEHRYALSAVPTAVAVTRDDVAWVDGSVSGQAPVVAVATSDAGVTFYLPHSHIPSQLCAVTNLPIGRNVVLDGELTVGLASGGVAVAAAVTSREGDSCALMIISVPIKKNSTFRRRLKTVTVQRLDVPKMATQPFPPTTALVTCGITEDAIRTDLGYQTQNDTIAEDSVLLQQPPPTAAPAAAPAAAPPLPPMRPSQVTTNTLIRMSTLNTAPTAALRPRPSGPALTGATAPCGCTLAATGAFGVVCRPQLCRDHAAGASSAAVVAVQGTPTCLAVTRVQGAVVLAVGTAGGVVSVWSVTGAGAAPVGAPKACGGAVAAVGLSERHIIAIDEAGTLLTWSMDGQHCSTTPLLSLIGHADCAFGVTIALMEAEKGTVAVVRGGGVAVAASLDATITPQWLRLPLLPPAAAATAAAVGDVVHDAVAEVSAHARVPADPAVALAAISMLDAASNLLGVDFTVVRAALAHEATSGGNANDLVAAREWIL